MSLRTPITSKVSALISTVRFGPLAEPEEKPEEELELDEREDDELLELEDDELDEVGEEEERELDELELELEEEEEPDEPIEFREAPRSDDFELDELLVEPVVPVTLVGARMGVVEKPAILTVRPSAGPVPKSCLRTRGPSTMTRRRFSSSNSFKKRPSASGMLRICASSGNTPEM
jgi:hypothetical protein